MSNDGTRLVFIFILSRRHHGSDGKKRLDLRFDHVSSQADFKMTAA